MIVAIVLVGDMSMRHVVYANIELLETGSTAQVASSNLVMGIPIKAHSGRELFGKNPLSFTSLPQWHRTSQHL